MSTSPWLTFLVFTPWIGALLLGLLPRISAKSVRWFSLLLSLSTLGISFRLLAGFDPHAAGFQYQEIHSWISSLNVHYRLGLDGMSLLLVLLTGIVGPASMLASWREDRSPRLFNALILFLQAPLSGPSWPWIFFTGSSSGSSAWCRRFF